jgi:hypothetical protein
MSTIGGEQIPRIGVDIGRVITSASTDGNISIFNELTYLDAPEVAGAVETMRDLIVPSFGTENTFLISKCGEKIQKRTTEWLQHVNFFGRTGVSSDNVRYCLKRPEKALIAAKLGLTHFIDDRPDVLAAMRDEDMPTKMLFLPDSFRQANEATTYRRGSLYVVKGWPGVRAVIEAQLSFPPDDEVGE